MTPTHADPVYLRIAADLRKRIRNGSLRTGQRVPSTRRLAKTWKVALATASKALGLLAQEGSVSAVPRVGYVVAGPHVRPSASSREIPKSSRAGVLGEESIVQAAIEMADREGLAALSMRGVAAKMNVPVTSLYRHVPRKDKLLQLMVDVVMAEEPLPPRRGSWRKRLELGARLEWRLMQRHPWVARVLTLTRPIPSEISLAHAEWMLSALEEAGASPTSSMMMHVMIYALVQGLAVNVESEAQAQGDTGLDESAWMRMREPEFVAVAAAGAFPVFRRTLETMGEFDMDLDGLFEFGLTLLLDGFARKAKGVSAAVR